jgi:hypothetical protein
MVQCEYKVQEKGVNLDWDENWWDNDYSWRTDVWYTMSASDWKEQIRNQIMMMKMETTRIKEIVYNNKSGDYRYKKEEKTDSTGIKLKSKDTTVSIKLNTRVDRKAVKEGGEETVKNEKTHKVSSYTGHMISVFNLLGIS